MWDVLWEVTRKGLKNHNRKRRLVTTRPSGGNAGKESRGSIGLL